jgi:hypothetical protein
MLPSNLFWAVLTVVGYIKSGALWGLIALALSLVTTALLMWFVWRRAEK